MNFKTNVPTPRLKPFWCFFPPFWIHYTPYNWAKMKFDLSLIFQDSESSCKDYCSAKFYM